MRNSLYFIAVCFSVLFFSCEKDKIPTDFIDFEEFDLGNEGFWNGSDLSGGFTTGNAFFRNIYSTEYQSWYGFSVSNHTDDTTPGYENQYSSIAGSGADESEKYAVLYSFSADTISFIVPRKVKNIALCNSTYAYYSMKDGDSFTEKFGGADGTQTDFFECIIEGVNEEGASTGTFTITLASFNQEGKPDFIGNVWTDIDLSPLGFIKYLIFSFDSSRKNDFGILTPTYICIDNIKGELME